MVLMRMKEAELTPVEGLFVVQKGRIPRIETGDWVLLVEGSVERPLKLTY